jgi:hypothetical protein
MIDSLAKTEERRGGAAYNLVSTKQRRLSSVCLKALLVFFLLEPFEMGVRLQRLSDRNCARVAQYSLVQIPI